MRSLNTLRERLKGLGPEAERLLPALDALEYEFELRARRIAALSTASHITAGLAGGRHDNSLVLDNVLMATLALSEAERSLVILADEGSQGYQVIAARVLEDAASARPIAEQAVRAALVRDSRLVAPELVRDDGDDQLFVAAFRSAMATPIVFQDAVIGCLYVDTRGPERRFSHADFETFRVFSRHASVALGLALGTRLR